MIFPDHWCYTEKIMQRKRRCCYCFKDHIARLVFYQNGKLKGLLLELENDKCLWQGVKAIPSFTFFLTASQSFSFPSSLIKKFIKLVINCFEHHTTFFSSLFNLNRRFQFSCNVFSNTSIVRTFVLQLWKVQKFHGQRNYYIKCLLFFFFSAAASASEKRKICTALYKRCIEILEKNELSSKLASNLTGMLLLEVLKSIQLVGNC